MDLVALIAALLGIAAAAAAITLVAFGGRGWLGHQCGRHVIVHETDDRSLAGTLITVGRDGLVLRGATYLEEEGTALAGEVFLPRDRVSFVQLP